MPSTLNVIFWADTTYTHTHTGSIHIVGWGSHGRGWNNILKISIRGVLRNCSFAAQKEHVEIKSGVHHLQMALARPLHLVNVAPHEQNSLCWQFSCVGSYLVWTHSHIRKNRFLQFSRTPKNCFQNSSQQLGRYPAWATSRFYDSQVLGAIVAIARMLAWVSL